MRPTKQFTKKAKLPNCKSAQRHRLKRRRTVTGGVIRRTVTGGVSLYKRITRKLSNLSPFSTVSKFKKHFPGDTISPEIQSIPGITYKYIILKPNEDLHSKGWAIKDNIYIHRSQNRTPDPTNLFETVHAEFNEYIKPSDKLLIDKLFKNGILGFIVNYESEQRIFYKTKGKPMLQHEFLDEYKGPIRIFIYRYQSEPLEPCKNSIELFNEAGPNKPIQHIFGGKQFIIPDQPNRLFGIGLLTVTDTLNSEIGKLTRQFTSNVLHNISIGDPEAVNMFIHAPKVMVGNETIDNPLQSECLKNNEFVILSKAKDNDTYYSLYPSKGTPHTNVNLYQKHAQPTTYMILFEHSKKTASANVPF